MSYPEFNVIEQHENKMASHCFPASEAMKNGGQPKGGAKYCERLCGWMVSCSRLTPELFGRQSHKQPAGSVQMRSMRSTACPSTPYPPKPCHPGTQPSKIQPPMQAMETKRRHPPPGTSLAPPWSTGSPSHQANTVAGGGTGGVRDTAASGTLGSRT